MDHETHEIHEAGATGLLEVVARAYRARLATAWVMAGLAGWTYGAWFLMEVVRRPMGPFVYPHPGYGDFWDRSATRFLVLYGGWQGYILPLLAGLAGAYVACRGGGGPTWRVVPAFLGSALLFWFLAGAFGPR